MWNSCHYDQKPINSSQSAQLQLSRMGNIFKCLMDVNSFRLIFLLKGPMRLVSSSLQFSYSQMLFRTWELPGTTEAPLLILFHFPPSSQSSIPLCSLWTGEVTAVSDLTPECNPEPCLGHSGVSTHCYITQLRFYVRIYRIVSRSVCETPDGCQEMHLGI